MRKKELADKEIEQEFSNLLLNDNITDWYKNEDDELFVYYILQIFFHPLYNTKKFLLPYFQHISIFNIITYIFLIK